MNQFFSCALVSLPIKMKSYPFTVLKKIYTGTCTELFNTAIQVYKSIKQFSKKIMYSNLKLNLH